MNFKPVAGLWITALIWTGAVTGLWARQEYLLRNGREITLQTVPVDPRDLFRGEYVVLRYKISDYTAPVYRQTDLAAGRTVYVRLRQRGADWEIGEVLAYKPGRGLFLKGKVADVSNNKHFRKVRISYGIESYFVTEGEGKRLEKLREKNQLQAVVSVTPDGDAKIKRLIEEIKK